MQQVVLTCDSVGKVTNREYFGWLCKEYRLPEPNYVPGADLPTLSIALKARMQADDAAWRPQVLVSMLNKLIDMNQEKWESAKPQYMQELWSLGLHSRVCHVPIVLVVGADVRLWTYKPFPDTYRQAQRELSEYARAEGLWFYTGMELEFR